MIPTVGGVSNEDFWTFGADGSFFASSSLPTLASQIKLLYIPLTSG
jgi:hypothetical protein